MANEENLIPNSERSPNEVRANARKGGINSGKTRRKQSNLKKAVETIMTMNVPDKAMKGQLEELGLDPTMEQAMALSVAQKAIRTGNYKALETLAVMMGANRTAGDNKEQRARIAAMEADTELKRQNLAKANGTLGAEEFAEQQQAIADLISTPQDERNIYDYLPTGGEGTDDTVHASSLEAD